MDKKFSDSTGMILDGIFSAECIDSSGEVVSIKGMDISTLTKDGVVNYEHKNEEKGNGEEVVGRIIYAKKIFELKDCEDARQEEYWDKVKVPYIYGIVRLFDGSGHPGAIALASAIRDMDANKENILVRYSIEGSTLKKENNKILWSIARRVALTWKPCNKVCDSGIVLDPNQMSKNGDYNPEFAPLGTVEIECSPVIDTKADVKNAIKNIIIKNLRKAIEGGNLDVAPSSLVGGAALQGAEKEVFNKKNKYLAMAALRDFGWDRKFDREKFKTFTKAKMPEASDTFLDHFADIAHDYSLKKSGPDIQIAGQNLESWIFQKNIEIENQIIKIRQTTDLLLKGETENSLSPNIHQVSYKDGDNSLVAGRFMMEGGNVHHLEDYHGKMGNFVPEGPISPDNALRINMTASPSQPKLEENPANGDDLAPKLQFDPMPEPEKPATFAYIRAGLEKPQIIEFGSHGAAMNGNRLSDEELEHLHDNVNSGLARLSYHDVTNIQKSEKDEDEIKPHVGEDPMMPGVGNKYAWGKFKLKNKPGVYVCANLNDFREVNKTSYETGDNAIKSVGNALKEVAKEHGAKLFRNGGDDFVAHLPTFEHASKFLRSAHTKLDEIPPVNGTHKLSIATGIGNSFDQAKEALMHAKTEKLDEKSGLRAFPIGRTPHLTHSLYNDEGAARVDEVHPAKI